MKSLKKVGHVNNSYLEGYENNLEGEQKLSGLNIFFEGAIGLFHSKMVIYDLEYLRL